MERLTDKQQANYLQSLDCVKDKDTWIYLKLAKLENLMEKYNIETLEQLDIVLFVLSGETKFRLKEIQEENQALKNRWGNLKDWVIDTKPAIRGANTLFTKGALLDKIFKLEKGEN